MIHSLDVLTGARPIGFVRKTTAVLAFAGTVAMAAGTVAYAAGPFAGMDGSWSGSGTVSMDSGSKERMRCTAQYVVTDGDNNLQQHINCSSPSYEFKVNTYVDHQAGSLSGYWEELKNNVRGNVTGSARGNHVRVELKGAAFSATLDLVTRGSSQSVTMTPGRDTNTQVQRVAITLHKA